MAIPKTASFFAILLFINTAAIAQSTISGTVTDAETEQPLPGVNVYFANSTIGTTTDKNGTYTIKTSKTGIFELIFSYIGYKKQGYQLKLTPNVSVTANASLKTNTYTMEELKVSASNDVWQENFERFEEVFIGETEYAKETDILNKEVLRFERDPKTHELLAFTENPLQVKNYALGYNIHVELATFRWDNRGRNGFFKMYAHFEEMKPQNEEQKRQWKRNRKKAYKGSFRHFMKSLYDQELTANDFEITNQSKIIPLSKTETKFELLGRDNTSPGLLKILKGFKMTQEIHINYTRASDFRQNAVLYPNNEKKQFFIDDQGNLLNPLSVKIGGSAWTFDRLANQLPFDYSIK